MNAYAQEQLLVCQEHEGVVDFIWRDHVPNGYEEEKMIDLVNDCDSWCIGLSITVSQLPRVIRNQNE